MKSNDKMRIENEKLKAELDHLRNQLEYHLPAFYKDGTLNCVLLAKIVKNEKKLS